MINTIRFLFFPFLLIASSCNKDNDTSIATTSPHREFEMQGSQYDESRHFFLGHFFRDNYEKWLETIPQVTSGVDIDRLEVYVLSRNTEDDTRNVVALMDLGEAIRIHSPDVIVSGNQPNGNPANNRANNLFSQLTEFNVNHVENDLHAKFPNFEKSTDYVKMTTARRLDEDEFSVNTQLGSLTILRRLQSDEVLAVSYQYSYNGVFYQVGEVESDYANRNNEDVIYLKMLRPNRIDTNLNTWDLMMKNIYNLNAAQVASDGFELRIIYRDDLTGQDISSLPEGQLLKDVPLSEVLRLDQLNENLDRLPDGNFDFIEGVTIDTRNGNIIFPVLEPFGSHLESWFDSGTEGSLIEKYVYDELYSNSKAVAELEVSKNKFVIRGKIPIREP